MIRYLSLYIVQTSTLYGQQQSRFLNILRRERGIWFHFKLCLLTTTEFSKNGTGVCIYSHLIYFRGADPVSKLKYGLPDD